MPEDSPFPLPVQMEHGLTRQERDYMMLGILVRIQHLRHAEALTLIEAMLATGIETVDVLMAKAVVESATGDHAMVLATIRRLDEIEPPEIRAGQRIDERIRVRSFMKARATFGLTGALDDEARASLDFYLRQNRAPREPDDGGR